MQPVLFTLIPLTAVLIGSLAGVRSQPSDSLLSALQHLAAGVVLGAAAVEILPLVMQQGSPEATLVGGVLGIGVMLTLKAGESQSQGPVAMLGAISVDILIDGLVLGLAFVAGARAGLLMTIALTLEVLLLGLTVTSLLGKTIKSKVRIVLTTMTIALLLPLGVLVAGPVTHLPPVAITGFLSFGLMALLFLVTEELLVEAHETPVTPLISAMFFFGFLGILLIEQMIG
jgi:ZIP family zinc transporter